MSLPLSKRLSPSAKKIVLRATGDEKVSSLVQVAPSINYAAFCQGVQQRGGAVRSWLPEANLATVEIGVSHLSELADMNGVVYVEAGQTYRR